MKLLHLDSSITGADSASRSLSAAIVRAIAARSPDAEVTHRDLVADPLPHLTLAVLADPIANEPLQDFLTSDVIVIGAGMYNFAVPSQLKAWIDRIIVAGQTFRYTEHGPEPLAGGKRVVVALTRGGLYSAGADCARFEHAENYLRDVFGMLGIVPEFIIAEGLKLGKAAREVALARALEQAQAIAIPLAA